jgi:hypothetical protein
VSAAGPDGGTITHLDDDDHDRATAFADEIAHYAGWTRTPLLR